MDFNIQFAAKTGAWGDLKTWVPALVGALVGVVVGFLLSSLRYWWMRRREVKNVRTMIRQEIECIKGFAENIAKTGEHDPQSMALTVDYLAQTHVYDAYLGRLGILKKAEIEGLQWLYHWLKGEGKGLEKINERVWDSGKPVNQEQADTLLAVITQLIGNTDIMLDNMEYYRLRWYKRMFRKPPSKNKWGPVVSCEPDPGGDEGQRGDQAHRD